jgi:hypothetical protein
MHRTYDRSMAHRALFALASLTSLVALVSTTSASAANSAGGLAARLGPVGPTGLHVGKFGTTAAVLRGGAVYGGKTSQNDPFALVLSHDGKRVAKQVMDIEGTCTSGMLLNSGGSITPTNLRVGKTGTLKGTVLSSVNTGTETGKVTVDLKGKLGSSRGSGTAHVHIDFVNKQTGTTTDSCDTGTLRWGATAAKGRVYGGSTSTGEPVVVELSRDLRRVSTLRIGWGAPCSPQGGFHIGDALGNFPLSTRRTFGDSFSMTVPADGGGQDKFDYQVQGKVGKSKASGRLQVHITSTDTSGATVVTCDSGVVSWRAVS